MKVRRIIRPGQPGAKKLAERFGDRLICLRYRYDSETQRVFKTVELILDDLPWNPWKPKSNKIPKNKMMHLRIAIDEIDLRNRVKSAGGKWNKEQKLWRLPYRKVLELGLSDRVVE